MPKSRTRKNAKKFTQIIPVQKKVPIGTELVDDPNNPGKKIHQTKVALVKTNQNRVIQHIRRKKG